MRFHSSLFSLHSSPVAYRLTTRRLTHGVLEWGDRSAPPVVLIHGTSATAHSWDRIAPALADRFRVIAYDLRNHGESDRSDEFGGREIGAADLEAIVDTLGIERFAAIGHSAGGGAAYLLAARQPGRISHLVLVDIGPVSPPIPPRVRAGRPMAPAEFETFDQLRAWIRRIRPYADEDWIDSQARAGAAELPDGRWRNKFHPIPPPEHVANVDYWAMLPAITCPTLVIRGDESNVLSAEDATRMIDMLPNARQVVIPRATHQVHEDNPDAVIRVLNEFFDNA